MHHKAQWAAIRAKMAHGLEIVVLMVVTFYACLINIKVSQVYSSLLIIKLLMNVSLVRVIILDKVPMNLKEVHILGLLANVFIPNQLNNMGRV